MQQHSTQPAGTFGGSVDGVNFERVYTDEEWNSHRETIANLYLHERKTLKHIQAYLRDDLGFPVTRNQLDHRMRVIWKLRKNMKKEDYHLTQMAFDESRRQAASSNEALIPQVQLSGVVQSDRKIKKGLWRYKSRVRLENDSKAGQHGWARYSLEIDGLEIQNGVSPPPSADQSQQLSRACNLGFLSTFIRLTSFMLEYEYFDVSDCERVVGLLQAHPTILSSFLSYILSIQTAACQILGNKLLDIVLYWDPTRFDHTILKLLVQCGCRPRSLELIHLCTDHRKIQHLVPCFCESDLDYLVDEAVIHRNTSLLYGLFKSEEATTYSDIAERLEQRCWENLGLRPVEAAKSLLDLAHRSFREADWSIMNFALAAVNVALKGMFREREILQQEIADSQEMGVYLMLKAGVDPNDNFWGQTPLEVAIMESKHLGIIERLLVRGANPNKTTGLISINQSTPYEKFLVRGDLAGVNVVDLFSRCNALDLAVISQCQLPVFEALKTRDGRFANLQRAVILALLFTEAGSPEFNFVAENFYESCLGSQAVWALLSLRKNNQRPIWRPGYDSLTVWRHVSTETGRARYYLAIKDDLHTQTCSAKDLQIPSDVSAASDRRPSRREWLQTGTRCCKTCSVQFTRSPDIVSLLFYQFEKARENPNDPNLYPLSLLGHLALIKSPYAREIVHEFFQDLEFDADAFGDQLKLNSKVIISLIGAARAYNIGIPPRLRILLQPSVSNAFWAGSLDIESVLFFWNPVPDGPPRHLSDRDRAEAVGWHVRLADFIPPKELSGSPLITKQRLAMLEYLLQADWDFNQLGRHNETLFDIFFDKDPASWETRLKQGKAAVCRAAEAERDVLQILMNGGMTLNYKCPSGLSPFARILQRNDIELAKLMLQVGPPSPGKPSRPLPATLQTVAWSGNLPVFRYLWDEGIDFETAGIPRRVILPSLLKAAVQQGHIGIQRFLKQWESRQATEMVFSARRRFTPDGLAMGIGVNDLVHSIDAMDIERIYPSNFPYFAIQPPPLLV